MAFAIGIFVARARGDRQRAGPPHQGRAASAPSLIVVTQTIDQEQAIEAIDFNTIGLLAGMMLIVRLTETTGVYTYLAIRAGQLSRGRPLAVVVVAGRHDRACCRRSSTTSRRSC